MKSCYGILPSDIFLLLTEKTQQFRPYLDDTLLNRLELSLYCDHVCHCPFWDNIHNNYYGQILDSLEETFDDLELYCGVLKLKFALLWHFKSDFDLDVYNKFGKIITSLIHSDDVFLCSLNTFFNVASISPDNLRIFSTIDSEAALPLLKKKWDQSKNIIHRSSIMTALMDILFSALFSITCSSVLVRTIAACFENETISDPFYQDFVTKFNIYSSRLGYVPLENAFKKESLHLASVFLMNIHSLQTPVIEDSVYVTYLLSPSLSLDLQRKICFELDGIKEHFSSARILRRILLNNVFKQCLISEFLIKDWYRQSLFAIEEPSGRYLKEIVAPLATCSCDFMQYGLFQTNMPQFYVNSLWKKAVLLFEDIQTNLDKKNQSIEIWLLFNKFIHTEIDEILYLEELLQYFENLFDKLFLFPFLIDCAFLLYTKCEQISIFERLRIFDKVFTLVTRECLFINSSGGSLFYSFFLLRIVDYTILHSKDLQLIAPLCLKLIELQKIVSFKAGADTGLLSNETAISIHKGLFLVKLIECDDLIRADGDMLRKLVELAVEICSPDLNLENGNKISGALKGIILSCLLSLLPSCDPSLSKELPPDIFCALLNDEIEEDPSIRLAVSSSWLKLLVRSRTSEDEQLRFIIDIFAADSSSYTFLHATASVSENEHCPSCQESLLSLLEDIIINKMSAGDTDCIGD